MIPTQLWWTSSVTLGMVLTLSEPESVVTIQKNHSVSGSSTCHSPVVRVGKASVAEASVRLYGSEGQMPSSLLPSHPEPQSPRARQDVGVFPPKAISGAWIVLTAGR